MRRIICALLLVCLLCVSGAAAYAETIILPQELTTVETETFYGDASVTEVVLPDGVETIGDRAFAGSGLKKINLPASVQAIAPDAFDGCVGLTATVTNGSYAHTYCLANGIAVDVEGGALKIVIVTGSEIIGEEEYLAAERMIRTYGADHVIHDTYPDDYWTGAGMQATKEMLLAYAEDSSVGAIIVSPSVQGVSTAFREIKSSGTQAPLLIAGVPLDDPDVIGDAADIALTPDEVRQGDTIIETCANWGIDVFVHYSFPRHLAMEVIAERKALLEANCKALGIEYVETTAPDPTGSVGNAGTQQFILEDVPLKMEEYAGKKVAFFATNCAMQAPLQTAVLAQPNAYYPQPCCPSPYHGFMISLGLGISMGGDDAQATAQLAQALDAQNAAGRFSTWESSANTAIIDIAFAYADAYLNNETTARHDSAKLKALIEAHFPGAKATAYASNWTSVSNYYELLLKPVDFNDYL